MGFRFNRRRSLGGGFWAALSKSAPSVGRRAAWRSNAGSVESVAMRGGNHSGHARAMRAAIFNEPRFITVAERPDAAIAEPSDAVVRVVLSCVCGSDLW